jgi:PAS domain-containing protein
MSSNPKKRSSRKTGKKSAASLTVSSGREAGGNTKSASRPGRDLAGAKEAEAALRESEERFRLVANIAPVMIWMSDVDKR